MTEKCLMKLLIWLTPMGLEDLSFSPIWHSTGLEFFFNTNITDFIQYISCYIFTSESKFLRSIPVKFWFDYPVKIFKTIITNKAILDIYLPIISYIFYYIQYYHIYFNIFLNNEFIPSILFSFIFLWNSFLNNR